jgi:hypothetical protein
MGTGLGRRSSLQRGQGEVGGSPYHGGERSDGACLAARLPACCGRGATCYLLLALQSGDRALHPDFYPGAEPIGPIPAPGFAAVSKSCLSEIS